MDECKNNYTGHIYAAINSPRMRDSRLTDTRSFHITLKQWKMLHAVVDCGGFADAAEYLHISQSAISYTIAKLQEQLGISVFKLEGRKAQLTLAGRELLERSRHLIKDAAELEVFAEKLRYGWESEVRLVITQEFPSALLLAALRRFSQLESHIRISLLEGGTLQAEKALFERTADLAISPCVPFGFYGSPLIECESVAVAHSQSPLLKLGREIAIHDLERHIQIIIADMNEGQYKGKIRPPGLSQQWKVSSFDTAIDALCEGIGYAWLPIHRVEKWLSRGELSILPLSYGRTYTTSLYLIYGRSTKSGSSLSTFAEFLQNAVAQEKGKTNSLSSAA